MDRRTVLRTTAAGIIASGGITALSGGATAEPDVISEMTLPEDGARGLGVNEDKYDLFMTTHTGFSGYYLNKDGSVESSWSAEDEYQAAALGNDAGYVGGYGDTLIKAPFDENKNRAERDMPDDVFSLAVDDGESVLWAGGGNGRIWRIDPVTLDIQESVNFGEGIFGLAYDGTYLWVGDAGRGHISQYDPSAGETVATYSYPNAQTIYDYAFANGHLWLEGDGQLYETDIDKSIPNESPTAAFEFSPGSPETGSSVTFEASSSTDPDGTVASYEWDLTGDGTVDATGRTVSETYGSTGEYRVTLTVTDDDGATNEVAKVVTVSEPPTARMSISPTTAKTGEPVTFSGSASFVDGGTIKSYEWDVTGDGDVDARGEEVTHTYESPGEYWVTLQITSDAGISSKVQNQITAESAETTTEDTPTTTMAETTEGNGSDSSDDAEESEAPAGGTTQPPDADSVTSGAAESESTPGFGIASGAVGAALSGYLLNRRFDDDGDTQ